MFHAGLTNSINRGRGGEQGCDRELNHFFCCYYFLQLSISTFQASIELKELQKGLAPNTKPRKGRGNANVSTAYLENFQMKIKCNRTSPQINKSQK